ncbi:guanine nucleotide-binding protein G(k) subunit alpha [Eurytemora carolleeae]|uniref:guanine nucleotide-binding protein G(k) subunit alpha n=1 Tax=Eurytemora carolleeae TaxID=1294199 RepID=UPI000C7635E4|nr:guanine nucleotide-binding protein G(k) subunit alpha [Eurytemora carolleeae]|eukprot:XP_023321619.1 guanine nucleotide-binding protein G(k) subunit alpha-like [Eurytemora affinis]
MLINLRVNKYERAYELCVCYELNYSSSISWLPWILERTDPRIYFSSNTDSSRMGSSCSTINQRVQRMIDEQSSWNLNPYQMEEETGKPEREIKLLLLGAGESGKSTIVKQMKIIHDNGYTMHEKEQFRPVVFCNTVQSLLTILKAMPVLKIGFKNQVMVENTNKFILMSALITEDLFPRELAEVMTQLWEDPDLQHCYSRNSEYQLNDSASYFLDNLHRLSTEFYLPTDQDILRTRVKTTGIVEIHFHYKNLLFRMFDAGGQRSERKKWIHCFDQVHAIIFCVAMSEYDLVLEEDQRVNRMHESMKLFNSICNNRWFEKASMILFLNKKDLFEEKIKVSPLTVCFPTYTGGNSFQDSAEFIHLKFQQLNRNCAHRSLYSHFTCGTDTNNVKFVFDAVTDILIKKNMHECGL